MLSAAATRQIICSSGGLYHHRQFGNAGERLQSGGHFDHNHQLAEPIVPTSSQQELGMSIILLLIAIGVTPETKAFLEMKQQQLKHNIVVDQAALDEIKRDGSLSTKDRTAQVNEASRRIAHLKLTRPDVPALRVPFVPFDADDVGTIKSLGKVKKVISDTSALIEFVGEETEIGSGTGRLRHAGQSGMMRQSAFRRWPRRGLG
jgi:hypothetical protein